ncbi:hypothetical protein [Streptomyces sp. RKAG337]|uniref:hypothetical protein n=1 Tax=Streptomyces sp. RKAG337 TaxID=2893404 RepID=UPI002033C9AC|nr:hypothetical protein [Streptomyces sp. RKAG337]MCM2430720.1 hypothetical protein [Streptomyces sp. RKAG337]
MGGLENHTMEALRRGTCPRLRSTPLGFAGSLAGDVNHQWIVERDADQNYLVRGWLNQR